MVYRIYAAVFAMIKIAIVSVGRPKERWIEEGFEEYCKRMRTYVEVMSTWVRDDAQLEAFLAKEKAVVCLDPKGAMHTSEKFSRYLDKKIEQGGARLTLAIGGAEGLPAKVRAQHDLISLSPMTFTHQMSRLILVEQIYRAFEIMKGTGYHK
jgi:23S rRNA (pseudouridine1915-N3)-methyltransferase